MTRNETFIHLELIGSSMKTIDLYTIDYNVTVLFMIGTENVQKLKSGQYNYYCGGKTLMQ